MAPGPCTSGRPAVAVCDVETNITGPKVSRKASGAAGASGWD